jgi:transcriptional regulator with XRE-family HTH domain
MKFGQRVKELRKAKNLGQRGLAERVGVSFTYISKIENHQLDFGEYPSDDLIRKLAKALDADEEGLLLLAEKIPEQIRKRVLQRPDAFRTLASLDDEALDAVLVQIGEPTRNGPTMTTTYTHILNLAKVAEPPADGILSRTIYQDDRAKAVVFGFGQGQELSEHTAAKPAMLFFVKGEAMLGLGEDMREARAETWVHMPANLKHSIKAKTPVVMLLVLLK